MVFTTTSSSPAPDKMQLQAILNRVETQKGFVYRNPRFANGDSEILVDIHPHGRSRPVCSKCGRKGPQYDTLSQRRFEFVPLWAIAVFFLYSMRRVDCPRCGVTVEWVPWADGKHHSMYSYRIFPASWAKRLSWKETATIFETSWDTVFRAVQWIVRWRVVHREIERVEAIGIDEIAYRRGHKDLTLVYQIDPGCRRLLYVAKDRTEQSLRGFFETIPESALSGLKSICTDRTLRGHATSGTASGAPPLPDIPSYVGVSPNIRGSSVEILLGNQSDKRSSGC